MADIEYPRRKPGRRPMDPSIPRKRINAVVVNGRLVDVFDALCLASGRRPHELVHDIVADYCRAREHEPEIAELVAIRQRWDKDKRRERGGLRLLGGDA